MVLRRDETWCWVKMLWPGFPLKLWICPDFFLSMSGDIPRLSQTRPVYLYTPPVSSSVPTSFPFHRRLFATQWRCLISKAIMDFNLHTETQTGNDGTLRVGKSLGQCRLSKWAHPRETRTILAKRYGHLLFLTSLLLLQTYCEGTTHCMTQSLALDTAIHQHFRVDTLNHTA